jgi:hypothetical protein
MSRRNPANLLLVDRAVSDCDLNPESGSEHSSVSRRRAMAALLSAALYHMPVKAFFPSNHFGNE